MKRLFAVVAPLVLAALGGCGGDAVGPPDASASATASASAAAEQPHMPPPASVAPRAGGGAPPVPKRVFVGPTSEHACLLTTAGELYCWGRNDVDQLGRRDGETFYLPRRVPLGEPVVEAALGERHTCAVLASGKVRCFGEDASGPRALGDDIKGVDGARRLAAGIDFTCALKGDGAVACFGRVPGNAGVTRAAERVFSSVGEGKAIDIAAASRGFCALLTPETIACVGENQDGALVKGGPGRLVEPTPVADLEKPISAISMADDGICALAGSGRVTCHGAGAKWEGTAADGARQFAYAADGTGCAVQADRVTCRSATQSSRRVGDVQGAFREVGVGRGFACALPEVGPVVCWGDNKHGVLGASPLRPRSIAFEVARLEGATRIEAGDGSVCGLVERSVRCFGDRDRRELSGSRRVGDDSAEAIVQSDDIAVGGGIRCGLTKGLASCWGDNSSSGIITESSGLIDTPVTLASIGRVKQLTFGATHACAILESGAIRCWGGAGRSRKAPADVPGFGEVSALEAGGRKVCALLADGGVSCAPFDGEGALRPVRVPGVRGLVALAVGGRHACGIDAKGTAVCFGENDQGQLGRNEAGKDGIVEVEDLPATLAITAGEAFTCALGDDAKVRCWGAGGDGQLGRPEGALGRAAGSMSVVDGLGPVKAITAGELHACALQQDGKVLCWGDRRFGRFFAKDVEASKDPLPIRLEP